MCLMCVPLKVQNLWGQLNGEGHSMFLYLSFDWCSSGLRLNNADQRYELTSAVIRDSRPYLLFEFIKLKVNWHVPR